MAAVPTLFILKILDKPFSVKSDQLVEHLIPVPVPLCPFLYDIPACKIQHFFQWTVIWKYTLRFGDFPVLAVQSFYDVGGIHNSPDVSGKLEERTYILPVIFPIADRIDLSIKFTTLNAVLNRFSINNPFNYTIVINKHLFLHTGVAF